MKGRSALLSESEQSVNNYDNFNDSHEAGVGAHAKYLYQRKIFSF